MNGEVDHYSCERNKYASHNGGRHFERSVNEEGPQCYAGSKQVSDAALVPSRSKTVFCCYFNILTNSTAIVLLSFYLVRESSSKLIYFCGKTEICGSSKLMRMLRHVM